MTNEAFGLLRAARGDWLRVKCEVAYVRMLLAGQRYLRSDRREERFNPYHDDLGRFTNANGAVLPGGGRPRDGASGNSNQAARDKVQVANSGGRGARDVRISPSAPIQTQVLFAQSRAIGAVARVRLKDPDWTAPSSITTGSGTITPEQELAHYTLIAEAAEARLRDLEQGGIGHNQAPRSAPGSSGRTPQNGPPAFSSAYRHVMGMPSLTGHQAGSKEEGTVAYTELGGFPVFGVNSMSAGFDSIDRAAAVDLRGKLLEKYPELMAYGNIGHKPNDALFHAEATVLIRAAKWAGGTLAGRKLIVHVDRNMCGSCKGVLPQIGFELGDPLVEFLEPNGLRRTMKGGRWR